MTGSQGGDRVKIELPFTARTARMINPALGIRRVSVGQGSADRFIRQETILDTADFRLLRSGVVLGHRVADQRGEWSLAAAGWQPWLPTERTEPMGSGDLPDQLAELIRPFRRSATLKPVAALEVEHWTYRLHATNETDSPELPLATLTDDRVTVLIGGVITARYREVELRSSEMTQDQREWVLEMLALAGGTVVEEFPELSARIGSPATGRTDFPLAADWDRQSPVDVAIGAIFAERLRLIMVADLSFRHGASVQELVEQLRTLGVELRGLAPLLGTSQDVAKVCLQLADRLAGATPAEAASVINSRGYLAVIDGLVRNVKSPKLITGIDLDHPPRVVDAFGGLLQRLSLDFAEACDQLTHDSPDEQWRRAIEVGEQLVYSTAIGQLIKPKRAARLRRAAALLLPLLEESVVSRDLQHPLPADPAAAFEAGRAVERAFVVSQHARSDALAEWARLGPVFR